MSIFRTVELPCPSCGATVEFKLVHSVNADRRPDLRTAIVDRSFQKEACPGCSHAFRVEPQFSFMHMKYGEFIAAWPSAQVDECAEYEKRTQAAFDHAYGKNAPPEAQDIGKDLNPRAVFGWVGITEKLIADEAKIDDVTLELAKLAIIRSSESSPVGGNTELRLLGVDKTELVLGWFPRGSEDMTDIIRVSKDLLKEIESEEDKWKDLRAELESSLFVDYRRFFLATT